MLPTVQMCIRKA